MRGGRIFFLQILYQCASSFWPSHWQNGDSMASEWHGTEAVCITTKVADELIQYRPSVLIIRIRQRLRVQVGQFVVVVGRDLGEGLRYLHRGLRLRDCSFRLYSS